MLDNENPYKKESIDNAKTNGNQIRIVEANIHERPKPYKGKEGINDLPDCFRCTWGLVLANNLHPVLERLAKLISTVLFKSLCF